MNKVPLQSEVQCLFLTYFPTLLNLNGSANMHKADTYLLSQVLTEHYFDWCNVINEGFNYFTRINLLCRKGCGYDYL